MSVTAPSATSPVTPEALRNFLDRKLREYNRPSFVPDDPISIPHGYKKRQDIEIAGFFTAIFSWGNRTTIIRKSRELMHLMDDAPHQFILNHREREARRLLAFKHRTFNATDLLYFVEFLRHHYRRHHTLEEAFLLAGTGAGWEAGAALSAFHHYFFSLDDVPPRTRKHIATPERNSTCKRLNMFLRWMVRKDNKGVDFGCWDNIPASRLICPLDLHVARVARRFGLLTRTPTDWTAAVELTAHLAQLDPADPVKYDLALFALGALEKF
ncbi:MAG TPA: TIGR02757 family protein [Puia sp.]|nr:TIGR02757 family protein [Puia sp.]